MDFVYLLLDVKIEIKRDEQLNFMYGLGENELEIKKAGEYC